MPRHLRLVKPDDPVTDEELLRRISHNMEQLRRDGRAIDRFMIIFFVAAVAVAIVVAILRATVLSKF
jgi:hypothetical protein